MKNITFAAITAIVTICGIIGYTSKTAPEAPNALALANIEALTQNEETKCPDFNYVPDHYIEAVDSFITVSCTKNGEISFGLDIFSGSYKKGDDYVVVVEVKNCHGVAKGACCDQREVGTTVVGVN